MARTDSKFKTGIGGTYIQTIAPLGYDILINGTDKYLNFNTTVGSSGYGFRDNGGTMEFKDSGGAWTSFAGSVAGVSSVNGLTGAVILAAGSGITLTPVGNTITIDATGGGGGTPGGSDTQVQYNNAGAFGGITGATTDGTTLTLVAPILGTPASATLTNATGLPVSTGISGLGTGVATWLATPSSANLAAAVTGETGTGALVFNDAPTFATSITGSYLTAGQMLITDGTKAIISATTATYPSLTELTYLKGVTSSIQTQINALVSGVQWKTLVACATTANITLSGEQTLDGVLTSTSRVLVKNQTTQSENGIYVSAAGAWARSTDADTGTELVSAAVAVDAGTLNGGKGFIQVTPATITIGASNIVWNQFLSTTYIGTTNRIEITGNVIDISSSYVGQSSITTLGTITTGVWNGTTIAVANGGTGITSFGAGIATWLGTPSSANLASAMTDETGSGLLVFNTAPTFATSITGSYLTASEILITDGSKNIVSAPVATYPSLTELSYLKGVTSAIQTQLTARALAATTITIAGTANQITSSAGAQDLSANRTWTLSFPADVIIPTVLTVPNTGLHILDTNATHDLIFAAGSNLTADRTFTITTGDTDMIVDFTAVTDEFILAYDTGTNTWRGVANSGGGANTALSNLASVAINTSLISDTNNTDDLGSTGIRWKKTWTVDLESTNMPTVGGTAILTSLTAPQFTTIELGHATDTTLARVSAGVVSIEGATIATLSATQTFTGQNKFNNFIDVNNAITASGNAATVPVTYRLNTVTNNSAATLTITMTTTSAVDGQMTIVRILDSSAVAQTITWVNTENSTVTAPTTSNGSTTLFLTVGFIYNSATSKWRCIAKA